MQSSIEPKNFDRSVKPTDDFFRFVNQTWIDAHPIPPDESRWGSFNVLRAEVERQIIGILEDLSDHPDADLPERARKVRDFYLTGMDMARRNAQGDAPLGDIFGIIDAISDTAGLARVTGMLHRIGVDVWWTPQADADAKRSSQVALYLNQGGLGLPDRDYYLNDDPKGAAIRKNYRTYLSALVAGSPMASGGGPPRVDEIMDLETKLARASMTRVELRDIEKQYHKFSLADLAALTPVIDWASYFDGAGMTAPAEVIVCQPDFLKIVNTFFSDLPMDLQKAYLRWHVVNDLARGLDEPREQMHFDFYGRTFSGAKQMKELSRRVAAATSVLLEDAVAELYVHEYFSGSSKQRINELVDRLFAAYRSRIERLPWMTGETKQKAIQKLNAVSRKLGYPDVWRDIGNLQVGTDSYAANLMNAHRFEFDRKMRQVGGPVDRGEWYMTPQSVNACYNPLLNEILFPAAILQPPFFDPKADLAVNFGGIGTVIGHELTHGFDDQGALFDGSGNLSRWWTDDDKKLFDAQTERLVKQFDKFEALPDLSVNGKLTLGENIADLGGIAIAYDGLILALRDEGGDGSIDGLTAVQRFFVSYAVTERGATREEALRSQVQIDPHAPSPFRVNGPLSNLQTFFDAFSGKPGDKLWRDPEDRVAIW
jgi:predicted metalloendopeptidase